jgi:hyaluronoglucosaminidase
MTTPPLGIIEGFFGRAWNWAERTRVVRQLAPAGYRFFHHAPKIDRFLRRDWRQPHPAEILHEMAQFASVCCTLGVHFGVGLTPYDAVGDFGAETRSQLIAKVKSLKAIGMQDLVILFDDIRGDVDDLARQQAEILAVAIDAADCDRVFFCPSYYSDDPVLDRVFGQRPADYLPAIGRLIDPAVNIYWTGEEVCSAEQSAGHLKAVGAMLGRPPSLWDNYPVNDGPRMSQYLHLRAFTGRSPAIAPFVRHHAINPASQPTLTCIPALTLPRAYAEGQDYRYGAALAEAAQAIAGEALGARLIADLLSLQDAGLDRLGERIAMLRARYAAFDHDAAREVVGWLDGDYAITGEMLETQ